MSHCEVTIRFDREHAVYAPGETVSGSVTVRADRPVRCNGLVVEHFWQTAGPGSQEHGVVQTQNVFQGELRPDEDYEAGFSFVAPAGPPTYQGRCVSVNHHVRARVDIPWSLDPVAEATYRLLPDVEDYPQLPVVKNVESQAGGLLRVLGLFFGLAFLLVGWLAPWPALLFLWPLGGISIYFSIRRWMVRWKVGRVRLEAPVRTAAPGESIQVDLRFTPRKDCVIRGAQAWLTCQEIAVDGRDSEQTTHTHQVYSSLQHFDVEDQEAPAGQPVVISKTVEIPETDAYSFQTSDNRIEWKLEVHVDIAGWADWSQTIPLIVRAGANGQAHRSGRPEASREPAANPTLSGGPPDEDAG